MKYLYPYLLALFWVGWTTTALGQQAGQIWQDQNANGRRDHSEQGIASVSVKAFDRNGQLIAETQSQPDGRYQLALPTSQPIRLTFSNLPAGWTPVPGHYLHHFGKASPAPINLGLYQPAAYLGARPRLALSMQPLGDHRSPSNDSLSTVILVDALKNQKENTQWVKPQLTGSIWSLAFDRANQRLFSAALAKRHSGFGPLGSGGIYVTELTTRQTKPFVDLGKLGIATGPAALPRDLVSNPNAALLDSLMFPWVGKMSLGGMDYADDDERVLYVMNLFDRRLYALPLRQDGSAPTPDQVKSYAVPNPGCSGGIFRPFAVKCHAGQVYIGGVCDAQASGKAADLKAYVYALNPTSQTFSQLVSLSLNYPRGSIEYGVGNWFAWTDDNQTTMLADPAWWSIHPQPILSDLEFDQDGSLILGFMDRLGHQKATGKGTPDGRWKHSMAMAAGDVLRVAAVKRHFALERNGKVGKLQTKGLDNQQGPGGGEFYYEDGFTVDGIGYHQESAMGGLAMLPTSGQLVSSAREPIAERNSGGLVWLNNQTGAKEQGLAVYHHDANQEFVTRKTNHVGDVELITEAPPMELGHRLWQDCDQDGMQDADEPGLAGISIELWKNGQRLAATQSDSVGRYAFDSHSVVGGLQARSTYEIRIAYTQERYKRLSLSKSDPSVDEALNNDAVDRGDYAAIVVTTGALGVSNQSLDFGFQCLEKPQVEAVAACRGTSVADAIVELTLKGFKAGERFGMSFGKAYQGPWTYASAQAIGTTGVVFAKALAELDGPDLSGRVLNAGGCYQDVYVSLLEVKGCAALLTQSAGENLQVSPNPTSGKAVVAYRSKSSGPVVLQLLSSGGKLLHQEVLSGSGDAVYRSTLDLSAYPTGLYIVSLQQNETVVSRKVIRR